MSYTNKYQNCNDDRINIANLNQNEYWLLKRVQSKQIYAVFRNFSEGGDVH